MNNLFSLWLETATYGFLPLLTGTGSNAAIEDVLNHSRYEGAIESISKVTALVDQGSIMFISFVSFLIISVAIWRNVLAGAYAGYPKFWDQVHVAHDEVKDVGWIKGILGLKDKYQDINMGSIKRMIMRTLPDIKVLTDFEDDTVEPKTYFTKAIFQMLAVVMIGVFIYNGYYRDTTIVVARFGSTLFERAILQTDPIEIYDRILATSGTPEFSTDNALTVGDKRINDMSHKAYSKIISKYTDIQSKSAKADLASNIESKVMAWLKDGTGATYIDSEQWDMSCDASLTATESVMNDTSSADGQQVSLVKSFNVNELGFESTKYTTEAWYLTMVAQFTKVNKTSNASYQLEMGCKGSITGKELTIQGITESGASLRIGKASPVVFTDGSGKTYEASYEGGKFKFKNATPSVSNSTELQVSNIGYVVNGREHRIVKIRFGASGAPVFKISGTSSADGQWSWGQQIDPNNFESSTESNKK